MSGIPYSTPRPRDRIAAMYDTNIISPITSELLVYNSSVQAWENLPASAVPGLAQNLQQVLTVGDNAGGLNIQNLTSLDAVLVDTDELLNKPAVTPDVTNNGGTKGMYNFIINDGSAFQQTTGLQKPFLFPSPTLFPTGEDITRLHHNLSLNSKNWALSQTIAGTFVPFNANAYVGNFGTQTFTNDEVFCDPCNMRWALDGLGTTWISCATPAPYHDASKEVSWIIHFNLFGKFAGAGVNQAVILKAMHWRSGVFLAEYILVQDEKIAGLSGFSYHNGSFVFLGLPPQDWNSLRDEWRVNVANTSLTNGFTITRLNVYFECSLLQ